jgi:hypothetical protein
MSHDRTAGRATETGSSEAPILAVEFQSGYQSGYKEPW